MATPNPFDQFDALPAAREVPPAPQSANPFDQFDAPAPAPASQAANPFDQFDAMPSANDAAVQAPAVAPPVNSRWPIVRPPSASWSDTFGAIPTQISGYWREVLAGMHASEAAEFAQATGETGHEKASREFLNFFGRGEPAPIPDPNTDAGKMRAAGLRMLAEDEAKTRQAQADIEAATPKNQNLLQRAVSGGATSLSLMVPSLAVGAATRSPTIALAPMYAATHGQSFSEGLTRASDAAATELKNTGDKAKADAVFQKGLKSAEKHATIQGLIEAGTEMLPAVTALKRGSPLFNRTVNYLIEEIPGESAATLAGAVDDYIAKLPRDATVQDAIEGLKEGFSQLPETLATVAVTGGPIVGAGHLMSGKGKQENKPPPPATQPNPQADIQSQQVIDETAPPSGTMPPPVATGSPPPDLEPLKASAPIRGTNQGAAIPSAPAPIVAPAPEPTAEPTQAAPPEAAPAPTDTLPPSVAAEPTAQKTEVPPAQPAPPVSTPTPAPQAATVEQPGEVKAGGTTAPEELTGTVHHGGKWKPGETIEGLGVHVTPDAALAKQFAEGEGDVSTMEVNGKKMLRVTDHGGPHTDASGTINSLIDDGALPKEWKGQYEARQKEHFVAQNQRTDAERAADPKGIDAWHRFNIQELARVKDHLKGKGYDGLIYENRAEQSGAKDSAVLFDDPTAPAPASQTPVSKRETASPAQEQITKLEASAAAAEKKGDAPRAKELRAQADKLRKSAGAIKQNQPAKRTAKPKSTESRLGDIAPGYTDEEHNAPDDADSGMTVDEGDDNAQAEFERLLARQNQESAGTGARIPERQDDSSGRGSRDVSRQGSRSEGTPTGNRLPREDRRAASEGKPLKVHRGAHAALTPEHYNDDALGFASGHPSSGLGVWFTNDESETPRFGPIQSSHDVDIRNPRVYTPSDPIPPFNSLEEAATLRRSLKAQGYDGVVQDYRSVQGPVHYVSFDASQVKDAAAAIEPPSQAQIDEASNTEPEEFDLSSEFDDDETSGGFTLDDQKLPAQTGGAPTGPAVAPRVGNAPGDPLRAIGERKAAEAKAAIERKDTTPDVAPKRNTKLGRSDFDSMWRDLLGLPEVGPLTESQDEQLRRAQNAPMSEQIKHATKMMIERFSFKEITIDPKLNSREAMDVLLDAYNNLHTMANVMSLPRQAMGFNGDLSLQLSKSIDNNKGTRGQFSWKFGKGVNETSITLARRADSFTHEWIHALDINLLTRFYKTRVHGVSELSAFSTNPLTALPPEISKAFTNVMRSLFLVDDAAAQKMAELSAKAVATEAALEKAKSRTRVTDPTVKADREAEVDKLKRERAETLAAITELLNKNGSQLHHASRYVDALAGREYFAIPTEMLARAGEAWMANRIGQQAGTEFLTGSPGFYNNNADRVMKLVYPNAAEREGIFQKFDALFAVLSKEQYFKGDTVAARNPGETQFSQELADAAADNEQASVAKQAYDAAKGDFQNMATAAANTVNGTLVKGVAGASRGAVENFKVSSLVTSFWSAAGRMDGLIRSYKGNPKAQALIRKFARMLALNPGAREETSGPTAQDKIDRKTREHQKVVDNIVKQYDLDPSNAEQMAKLYEEVARPTEQVRQELIDHNAFLQERLKEKITENERVNIEANLRANNETLRLTPLPQAPTAPIQKAALAIRKLQDRLYYEAQEAGIDLGYVSNYMRRALNHEAITKDKQGFIDKATLAYQATNAWNERKLERAIAKETNEQKKAALQEQLDEVQRLDPERQANDYLWALQVPDVGTPQGLTTPSTKFTKKRTLAPAADLLLADYYDQNPIRSLYNSISASVYRTTYAEMFGASGEKLDVMRKEMVAAGVSETDIPLLDDAMRIAFGQTGNFVSTTDAFVNWAMLLGQIKLLGKSAFTNFMEPSVTGIRTGSVIDSFKALGYTYLPILSRAEAAEQQFVMETLGLVASTAHETVFANRSGLSGDNALLRSVYTGFGKLSKLQWLTERARAGSFRVLSNYLHFMALQAADGKGARANEAHDELNELGIPRDKHAEFSEFMRGIPKGRMGTAMLLESGNQEMKEMYGNAMHVLMRQSIQEAQRVERARGSFHPLGRFIFSITNFTRSFERNVIMRNLKQITTAEGGGRKFAAAVRFGSTAGALTLLTILANMARDWWDDPERAEKKRKDGEYFSGKGVLSSLDRAGFTGRFTLLYNMVMKNKYDREVSALTAGAVPSFYIDSFKKVGEGFQGDATTKQQRDGWGAFYDLTVGIGAPLGATLTKVTGPIGWMGVTKLQSRGWRDAFVESRVPKTLEQEVAAKKKDEKAAALAKETPAQTRAREAAAADKKKIRHQNLVDKTGAKP